MWSSAKTGTILSLLDQTNEFGIDRETQRHDLFLPCNLGMALPLPCWMFNLEYVGQGKKTLND